MTQQSKRYISSVLLAKACNVGDEGGFAPNVQDNNEVHHSFRFMVWITPVSCLFMTGP